MIENIATKSDSFVEPIKNKPIKVEIWADVGAVGPLILKEHPPKIPPIIPPMIAPIIPAIGPKFEISPKASDNGKAIIATVIPEKISLRKFVWIFLKLIEGLIKSKIFIFINQWIFDNKGKYIFMINE